MIGANGSIAGTAGAVPGPAATDNVKFLRGDGTWAAPAAAAAGATNQIQYNSGGALTGNANFVYSGGNVGIGTTTPGQKVSVVGIVESTTGGFKYPNGTIQTSASPAVGLVTLTDAASIIVDGSLGAVYKVTLGGNRTLANPTNLVPGAIYSFMFTQDATGSRSLTFGSSYHFPSGISTPALSSAAGVTDAAQFVSDGTYLYYMSGFASATAPCYAPTNVSVTVGIGAASVTTTLTWYDTNSNETSYSVERSADGVTGWTALTSVAANSTTASYTDANLGTQSYYWRATANCGVSGSNSSIALQGTSSVTTPTNLTQTRSGNTTALIWTDTPSEDSYQIERAVNGGAWGNITNPALDATSYTDTGLDPNTVYTYRIRAVKGSSYSAYGVASMACPTPATFTCGYAGNDCYSNINAVLGASAVTPNGRCLTMLYANGSSGFLVWKDQSSAKILSPTGLDSWSMALNLSGKGRSSTAFSDPNLGTATTILAGRACPTNVYIDDSNKVSIGNCLYYSPTYAAQYSNSGGDDSGAQLGFSLAGQWYSGNLATCSSKRMRLPTLFETTVSTNPGGWVANDAAPTFSSTNGVPSTESTLTASGENAYGGIYRWSGSSTSSARGTATPGAVRCVIP
jgi:hypothetical protein